jgi:single-stranded DNA-binding protein
MNWNASSTGTVTGQVTLDDNGTLRASVVAIEKYIDANGVEQRKNLLFFLAYKGKNAEDMANQLKPNTRVGFEGFFNGPSVIKNEAYPTSLTVNGPAIYYTDDGEPFCALNVAVTNLRVIGLPIKKLGDVEDITTVLLWGFLGRNAEQQYTTNGHLVTRCSIASNRFFYQGEGEDRTKYDVTTWWRVSMWGEGGNSAIQYWTKGAALIFKGTPNVDNATGAPSIWTPRDGGDPRASYELTAYAWTFAPSRRGSGGPAANDNDYEAPASEYDDDEIPF